MVLLDSINEKDNLASLGLDLDLDVLLSDEFGKGPAQPSSTVSRQPSRVSKRAVKGEHDEEKKIEDDDMHHDLQITTTDSSLDKWLERTLDDLDQQQQQDERKEQVEQKEQVERKEKQQQQHQQQEREQGKGRNRSRNTNTDTSLNNKSSRRGSERRQRNKSNAEKQKLTLKGATAAKGKTVKETDEKRNSRRKESNRNSKSNNNSNSSSSCSNTVETPSTVATAPSFDLESSVSSSSSPEKDLSPIMKISTLTQKPVNSKSRQGRSKISSSKLEKRSYSNTAKAMQHKMAARVRAIEGEYQQNDNNDNDDNNNTATIRSNSVPKIRAESPQDTARKRIRKYKIKEEEERQRQEEIRRQRFYSPTRQGRQHGTAGALNNKPPSETPDNDNDNDNKDKKPDNSRPSSRHQTRTASPQAVARDRIRKYKVKEQHQQEEEERQRQELERAKSPTRTFKWTAEEGHMRAQMRVMIRQSLSRQNLPRSNSLKEIQQAAVPILQRANSTRSNRSCSLSPRRTVRGGELGSPTWHPTVPQGPSFALDKKYGEAKSSTSRRGNRSDPPGTGPESFSSKSNSNGHNSKNRSASEHKRRTHTQQQPWKPTVALAPKFALDARYGDKTQRSSSTRRHRTPNARR